MINTDLLFKYESDIITEDEFLQLFQEIYDTQAWKWLQGHYGRTLSALTEQGLIQLSQWHTVPPTDPIILYIKSVESVAHIHNR